MAEEKEVVLEGGTYEIIKSRLDTHGKELRARLQKLNNARKDVFGAIETKLLGSDRITTANNCTPRDMVPIGSQFIFGYNVQVGLRAEIKLEDVFSVYTFEDHHFKQQDLALLDDAKFHDDFKNLYRYYKKTYFVKFAYIGPYLFMVFRVGKSLTDIKTFKWLIEEDGIKYVDARSDSEFSFPNQHDFVWQRCRREAQRHGVHPHISIEDRVFVETVGGDLTIKIEDNSEDGVGIYNEPVDNPDQTLDDAEFHHTLVGHLILLKIKPYQERQYRYFVFNEKLATVTRIDAIEDTCIFLPDDQGIIFPSGYYLSTGDYKLFDNELSDMLFDRKVSSPNGEDYLYIFYQQEHGHYVLMSYNIIEQKVNTPILCEGYSIFDNGELVYFKGEAEPQKHHTLQFWQTPYVSGDFEVEGQNDNALFKIGNKDIVRAMAECYETLVLIEREDVYASLYVDIVKKTGDINDSYFWLADDDAHNLSEVLLGIKETAGSAVDEFEKVQRVRKATAAQIEEVSNKTKDVLSRIKRTRFTSIDEFVHLLAELRSLTGEIISAKELRYSDIPRVTELETQVVEQRDKLSGDCVNFLLEETALAPYQQRITEQAETIQNLAKVAEAKQLGEDIDAGASELELLIEIVSNLKIDDPTQTTRIIDNISALYTKLNQIKAELKTKTKDLAKNEGVAEFNAQIKLLSQAMVNYLDVSDSPDKCEGYLTKLMVQLEELEAKFADFDEFVMELTEKRDQIYNAFEAKKLNLIEARNKRATALNNAADRILKGIRNRIGNFKTVNEINGYFAGDLMIEKVRDIVKNLVDMEDSVKADSIQSQLKTIKEDAVRQLKDRQDLFEDGANVIKMGNHRFSVNSQALNLTTVFRDDHQYYHLTGTNFFYPIKDEAFEETRPVWSREYVSESPEIYRGEFLAYQFLKHLEQERRVAEACAAEEERLLTELQTFMGPRYQEGYSKGVHDQDAFLLLQALLGLHESIGLLVYPSEARALAALYWKYFCPQEPKELFTKKFKGLGAMLSLFPDPERSQYYIAQLQEPLQAFVLETKLFAEHWVRDAATYLFKELISDGDFVVAEEAGKLYSDFDGFLRDKRHQKQFQQVVEDLNGQQVAKYSLIRDWIGGYVRTQAPELGDYCDEVAVLFCEKHFDPIRVVHVPIKRVIKGLKGDHPLIQQGTYELQYNHFIQKMETFEAEDVPRYNRYISLKKSLVEAFKSELRLEEFKPRILSSFVRNQLIDKVYLPIIGDNLAKQMGVVGEKKRTDLMGMLLLISPPGYGKTTLMEYVADRLGLIFMKINGPAIGHQVTSVDPNDAPNSAARDELNKLNLAFEMGDNVMIYIDDIQHCNPEFLQKFISLCDGQRKIEGVYKGVSRTYDLRGKKVAVVMAGNPYTESGDKFQIPDMLANRADTYNLGDIIGDSAEVFELSYLENCLTSNPYLNKLMSRGAKDVHGMIKIAQTGSREGVSFEGNYSAEEVNESVNVLKKLLRVRDVILAVNLAYIRSAAQADEYRTEPAFKLQGSYRNMNKIAEKVLPIMNEEELETLILSHYENESQTLTSGAEANLLKFKELTGIMGEADEQRWTDIKETFKKNQSLHGVGGDRMGQAILQLAGLGQNLEGIKEAVGTAVSQLGSKPTGLDPSAVAALKDLIAPLLENMGKPKQSQLTEETIVALRKIVGGAVKALNTNRPEPVEATVVSAGNGLDADAIHAMREMFTQTMEGLHQERRQGGLDEESIEAMREMVKMLKTQTSVQGREERQAMLILLEKQFGLMDQWLKTIQESSSEQENRLSRIETTLERSMSSYEWVIQRLKELNQPKPQNPNPTDVKPEIRR